ncbi:MAG: hypothetical protein R3A44_05990 [Caldilineaceae bacterium]
MKQLHFGKTDELTNTRRAPLRALLAYYEAQKVFEPLQKVTSSAQKGEFELSDKLVQLVLSILSNCRYISEVNTKLRPERQLAQVKRIAQFAEQSTLSLALNGLSQTNIEQLRSAVRQICDRCSRTQRHDWRGLLMLDFDLSGLPCGKQAIGSQKGYFAGKKTARVANWRAPMPLLTKKLSGPSFFRATMRP